MNDRWFIGTRSVRVTDPRKPSTVPPVAPVEKRACRAVTAPPKGSLADVERTRSTLATERRVNGPRPGFDVPKGAVGTPLVPLTPAERAAERVRQGLPARQPRSLGWGAVCPACGLTRSLSGACECNGRSGGASLDLAAPEAILGHEGSERYAGE